MDKSHVHFFETVRSAYQSRPMLKGYFHPYLQRHDPARFEPVRQRYEVRIAALDAQIAALQPA